MDTIYGREQFKFNNFCFKAFAAERLPDSMKARGFNQRILEIPCVYGFLEYDISEVVNPAGEEEFQDLLDELLDARNRLLIYRLLTHHKKIFNIKLNLRNRENQLYKPVLRMFQKTETLNELLPVISKYVSQKWQANANTIYDFLYEIVKEIKLKDSYELESSDIWLSVISNLECSLIAGKPLSYDSAQFGVISQKMVTQIMKDVFGTTPPKSPGSSRRVIFDVDKLMKIGKVYEHRLRLG